MECMRNRFSDKTIGNYYQLLHNVIIVGGAVIVLFNNNPYHLLALLGIVSLDAFANVVCNDCPLTSLERKYLKSSLSHDRRKWLKSMGIMYKCSHIYESQVELIVNVWTAIACKIIIILALNTFTPLFLSQYVAAPASAVV